ncbi:MAG: Hsp70 family protein [Desulfobacterales bacterium]|nr:Hsp70 family protein [Desulfobacterales bacterium]
MEPTYIIGIDLGTTNSIVAYVEATVEKGKIPAIQIFSIAQLVGSGVIEDRDMIPSFVFIPGKHDVSEKGMALPWDAGNTMIIGEFARDRGLDIPMRLISSSKSWLCNPLIDRNKPILPWQSPDEVAKLSPVESSSAILKHIRYAWDHFIAKGDEQLFMEHQEIYLTVPASFDAVARELTVNAAKLSGLSNITLLEEPQAAFYAWIESFGEDRIETTTTWRNFVQKGDLILVCDIGGGTTDFSLIEVSEAEGQLALERIAVGDHLLVGGDNMDLALAHNISEKLAKKKKRLDTWQMRSLSYNCRKAKEILCASLNDPDQSYPITLLGRGSSLIGGTIKAELTTSEVKDIILEGFFPKCSITDRPQSKRQVAIKEFGLKYEADPAITKHIAQFISQQEGKGKDRLPTAVFFNGGVMKSKAIRERILEVLSSWTSTKSNHNIREIENQNFDLSVARGAAYYGIARHGRGIRIRSGLGKSYYISVAAAMPAVPGVPTPIKALCVAPFGMEEGTKSVLKDPKFILVVGENVKFDLLGSSVRTDDTFGQVVEEWDDEEIEEITTIETLLEGDIGNLIPVYFEISITEVGTLEFYCVSKEDGQRWRLEFNVREKQDSGTV